MRKSIILLFIFLSIKSHATGQMPDYLIQNKDTLKLHCNPLESYFEKNPIRKGIINSRSSALWRGYIAYFKITDNKLVVENIFKLEYIKDSQGKHIEKLTSIYVDVFGNNQNFECVFYSGVLICPLGEMKEYVHMGYGSIYENYKLIEVKNGIFQKEKSLSDKDFLELKINHFKKFKETEEYKIKFDEFLKATSESEKEMSKIFGGLSDEDKKRKKQNKYLYEKEKELENRKMTENFLFLFISDNIKTIDITN